MIVQSLFHHITKLLDILGADKTQTLYLHKQAFDELDKYIFSIPYTKTTDEDGDLKMLDIDGYKFRIIADKQIT